MDRNPRVYRREFRVQRSVERSRCSSVPRNFESIAGVKWVLSGRVNNFIGHILPFALVFRERTTARLWGKLLGTAESRTPFYAFSCDSLLPFVRAAAHLQLWLHDIKATSLTGPPL